MVCPLTGVGGDGTLEAGLKLTVNLSTVDPLEHAAAVGSQSHVTDIAPEELGAADSPATPAGLLGWVPLHIRDDGAR